MSNAKRNWKAINLQIYINFFSFGSKQNIFYAFLSLSLVQSIIKTHILLIFFIAAHIIAICVCQPFRFFCFILFQICDNIRCSSFKSIERDAVFQMDDFCGDEA